MPISKKTADAPGETRVLDPEFIAKHDLPQDYVDAVEAGLLPPPPKLGPDDGSTEQVFAGGAWQVVKKGMQPGESTAISR